MTPPVGLLAASPEVPCSYKSRNCNNPRAFKRNGQLHTLCEFHRARQNQHQRKSDRKLKVTRCKLRCESPLLPSIAPGVLVSPIEMALPTARLLECPISDCVVPAHHTLDAL